MMEAGDLSFVVLLAAGAERAVEFYSGLLGLALVEDARAASEPYLRFTDAQEQSGSYLLLLLNPDSPRGKTGPGAIHHLAFLAESTNAQLKWKRWLADHDVDVMGPYDRGYFRSIYFRDPDGTLLEIATRWPGLSEDEPEDELGSMEIMPAEEFTPTGRDEAAIRLQTWPEPLKRIGGDMDLRGLHHVSAIAHDAQASADFYERTLGLHIVKRTRSYDDVSIPHLYLGAADGHPGSLLTLFGPGKISAARPGLGVPLAVGFAAGDEASLDDWRRELVEAGSAEVDGPQLPGQALFFRDSDGILVAISE